MSGLRVVDFFSGIGGFSLGLERVGFKTVAFSEIDPYACAVLKKHWPDVPNLGDITKLTAESIPDADLWCGGFPCQDISAANQNARGLEGERSGLWWEIARLIKAVRPRWVCLENVPALLGWQFGDILRFFSEIGYRVEWEVLSAAAFGALHRRERVWIVAHPESDKWWSVESGSKHSNSVSVGLQGGGRLNALISAETRGYGLNLRDWFQVYFNMLYPPVHVVEWLMGFPLDHTDCGVWVIRSSRKSRRGLGKESCK